MFDFDERNYCPCEHCECHQDYEECEAYQEWLNTKQIVEVFE